MFSYWMLCNFVNYNSNITDFISNITIIANISTDLSNGEFNTLNKSSNYTTKNEQSIGSRISWIECLIIVWVSAYLCQIMREVYAKDYLKIFFREKFVKYYFTT